MYDTLLYTNEKYRSHEIDDDDNIKVVFIDLYKRFDHTKLHIVINKILKPYILYNSHKSDKYTTMEYLMIYKNKKKHIDMSKLMTILKNKTENIDVFNNEDISNFKVYLQKSQLIDDENVYGNIICISLERNKYCVIYYNKYILRSIIREIYKKFIITQKYDKQLYYNLLVKDI
jgi:hypothetical protein